MPNLTPSTWRRSIEQLRDNVVDTFDRWLPQRSEDRETALGRDAWPLSLFTHAGPPVDLVEHDDKVEVTAELPGLSEEDFSVELSGDRLILKGEKKANREEKKRDYYYAECSYGSFTRSIPLPCGVDIDKATAKYTRGVLNVTLPKAETAKAKRVKVDVS